MVEKRQKPRRMDVLRELWLVPSLRYWHDHETALLQSETIAGAIFSNHALLTIFTIWILTNTNV